MAVTTAEVLEIMDGESTREDLSTFIDQANTFYSEVVPENSNTEAMKDIIVKYIAAHFVALSDGIVTQSKNQDFSRTFLKKSGDGLKATSFGRTAILFDQSGVLANQKTIIANMEFLG